jgi:ATP-binding cassette subfamily F protein 3
MLVRPAALLALDEPTNHLDLASREVLESALAVFGGTIVFISHDRYFINRIATRVVDIEHGRLANHLGTYDDFLADAAGRTSPAPAPARAAVSSGDAPRAVPGRPAAPVAPAPDQRRSPRETKRGGSGELRKLRQRLEEIERRIAEVEARLAALADAMAAPDLYRDGERARAAISEQKNAQEEVAWLLREWEELSTAIGEHA